MPLRDVFVQDLQCLWIYQIDLPYLHEFQAMKLVIANWL